MPHEDRRRNRRTTTHHVVPRSRLNGVRNKSRGNIVEWDETFHEAWHTLFVNMSVDEVHLFIERVNVPGEVFTSKRLNAIRSEVMRSSQDVRRHRRAS